MTNILCKTCGGTGTGETFILPDCPEPCEDCFGTGRSDTCYHCHGSGYDYEGECPIIQCYDGFTTDPDSLKGELLTFETIKEGDFVIDDENTVGFVINVDDINNVHIDYVRGMGFYCLDPTCTEHEPDEIYKIK